LANIGFQPDSDQEPGAAGQFLTFVVPAPSGCNLRCPFCFIRQRREISETRLEQERFEPAHLGPEDMARFVREAAQRAPIFALAVQGYEPLLPESLPYTRALLAAGRFLNLRTTLVTNGIGLVHALDLLKTLTPAKIAVSLDSAEAGIHDRIRGVRGAWDKAVAGMTRARAVLSPQTRLVVASVLIPSRRLYLDDMPARLREMGIDRWIVNPLVRVGRRVAGGPVGNQTALFRDLLILHEAADRAGVRLTVDDEFGHLGHDAACVRQPALRALHVRTLPPNVELFRLTPDGWCSQGSDVLNQITSSTPCWRPGMHAGDFLAMLGNSDSCRDAAQS
jgi:MoaA/NifB/PqqE/SkfB family radical SAM enzyme